MHYAEYPQIPLSDFIPEIVLPLNDCPDEIAITYTRTACIDFARATLCATRHILIHPQVNVANYRLSTDDNTEIISVRQKININNPREMIKVLSADEILIIPTPVEACKPVHITVFVEPAQSACLVDKVFAKYRETIISGALMRLYKIPNTKWFDLKIAAQEENNYINLLNKAKNSTILNFNNTAITLSGRRYI